MRLTSAIVSVLLFLLPVGVRAEQAAPLRAAGAEGARPIVRVLTYNIHHGEGRDGKFDLVRQAEIMKSARPDVIALQEVDQGTDRASGVMQLDSLAKLMDMHAVFGRTMDLPGGSYGIAVLSRWPILLPDNRPLPSAKDNEPRAALTVIVRCGRNGPLVQFTSTHFDNTRESTDRMDQARYLDAILSVGDTPNILAGDFNARWDTDIMQVFAPHWTNPVVGEPVQPPGPNGRPRGRADYVLYRPAASWRVVESVALEDNVASDHRAVLTVLEWLGTS